MQSLKEAFATTVASGTTNEDTKCEETPVRNPLIVNGSAFDEDVEDDHADLGIRLGKLRISDRIGGFFRPRMVEELTNALNYSIQRFPEESAMPQLLQPPSGFTEPSSVSVKPGNVFFREIPESDAEFCRFPDKRTAELLLSRYWEHVHSVARVLHRNSFEERWKLFWRRHVAGEKCEKSLLALVSTVLLSGLVSMPDEVSFSLLRYKKQVLMENLKAETDSALARSNWVSSTKLEMLQAVVIYLIAVCREEVSRTHSNIVAAAIRTAEGIGLHEDGVAQSYTPVQIHVRRLLWYQLLLLDIRTCEATGPRPQIRDDDFSTILPLNVDEHTVHLSSKDSKKWTDMTVTLIRMRCNEFIREIWTDRMRLQKKQVTVSGILVKIQAFDRHMQGKFGRMADMNVPLQRYGCLVAKILTLRTYAMVLHQYALHPEVEMSDNLKKIFIKYGVETMDAVQDLETAQDLAPWRWLAGAIQQHHYALAMLLELLKNPFLSQATALLRGLDYVFEPPQHLGLVPIARVRCVVIEMRNRMKVYVAQRKPRALRDSYGSGEPLDSERLETSASSSSTRFSITPQEAPQTPQAGQSTNDRLAGIGSSTPSPERYQEDTSPDSYETSITTDVYQQDDHFPQIQHMDIDMPSLTQHFPDIIHTDLTMSSENMHRAQMTNSYPPYVSHQSQLPTQWTTSNDYFYYAPQLDGTSAAHAEGRDTDRADRYQHEPIYVHGEHGPSFYSTSAAAASPLQMSACTHLTIPPTSCIDVPASSYHPGPGMQGYETVPMIQHDQQDNAAFTTPFSDLNANFPSMYDNWYSSNGGVPVNRGTFGAQDADLSFGR